MTIPTLVLSPQAAHTTHFFFEWASIFVGAWLYRRLRKQRGAEGAFMGKTYWVTLGCIFGAALGNKLVFWIEFADRIPDLLHGLSQNNLTAWALLFSGQSIVGGFLGGLLGVELAKKLTGVTRSTGDDFVLPLVAGTVIGRTGCFLAGLNDGTYGIATSLPWGMDFGDGIARHPTQLYDMLFAILWGGWLWRNRVRFATQSGLIFKLYLTGYLLWRLCVDAIKPIPYVFPLGLSGIQVVCIVALILYSPFVFKQLLLNNESRHV